MAKRYYSVQYCDCVSGWQDIGVYSFREKPCNDHAKECAEKQRYSMRVIRKPHGFKPSNVDTVL